MKNNANLTNILNKSHENKWVALSPDHKKVIEASENLLTLTKKVGNKEVVYMKVPPSNTRFAF